MVGLGLFKLYPIVEGLRLSFYDGQPHAAIAEALAIPLGTVKSRIRLAVTHLRQRLEYLK